MLYKKRFIPLILNGTKTQTRRLNKPRYKVGDIVPAQTSYYSKPFAKLEAKRIWQELLSEMTIVEARAEGFDSISGFCLYFKEINHIIDSDWEELFDKQPIYAIEFELA